MLTLLCNLSHSIQPNLFYIIFKSSKNSIIIDFNRPFECLEFLYSYRFFQIIF
jgi:hypothetical protein